MQGEIVFTSRKDREARKIVDAIWLSNGIQYAMPTLRIEQSEEKVKVAVVFEPHVRIRPVWFEVLGKERVQVGEICGTWYHNEGSAKLSIPTSGMAGRGAIWCATLRSCPGASGWRLLSDQTTFHRDARMRRGG